MKLPDTWRTFSVSELGAILKGKGIAKDEVLPQGLPCVRYGEIYTTYNNYFAEAVSFVNEKSASESQEIKKGDILFAGSGETAEEIGKCVAYTGSKQAYAGGDIVILRPKNVDSIFLAHTLNSEYVVKQKAIYGQGHSVVHIYPNAVGQLEVHLPPLPEQKKIAAILSTWDKAIDAQTKLIAAKEKQKKALMQKLLSGVLRLDGQQDEWLEKRIADVCKIKYGKSQKDVESLTGVYPIVGTGGEIGRANKFLYDRPSVLIGRKGTIDTPQYYESPFWAVDTTFYTEVNTDIFPKWLYYAFQLVDWKNYNEASGVPSLSAATISEILLNVPPYEEQMRITSILESFDKEIICLEGELSLLRKQKKGLMQNLLTGKIRVQVD